MRDILLLALATALLLAGCLNDDEGGPGSAGEDPDAVDPMGPDQDAGARKEDKIPPSEKTGEKRLGKEAPASVSAARACARPRRTCSRIG